MPIRVTCPACHLTFRVAEEYAGQRGRCPHCEEPVRVPDKELPLLESVPEDEYDSDEEEWPRSHYRERTPRPSPRKHLPAWRRVSLGFLIQQAGAGLNLLALALVISAMTVLAEDPGDFEQEPTVGQTIASSIGALAALFGLIAQVTGRFMSATTPVRAPRAIGLVSAIGSALLLPALCAVGGLAIVLGAGGAAPAAVAIVGLGMFGYMMLWTACEATHGFAMGSVGRVLRADGLRAFGRLMGVAVIVGGVLAIFCLCGLGAWADANNPNGQNAAANKAEDKLFLGWLIAAGLVTGLYLMLDVVLLQKGRAAVAQIAEPEADEDTGERWD